MATSVALSCGSVASANGPTIMRAMRCRNAPNRTRAIATLRSRQRRPAVIMESQSRQESRSSCEANQAMVAGWVMWHLAPSCPALCRASTPLPHAKAWMGGAKAAPARVREWRKRSRRLRLIGDQREERLLEAGAADAGARRSLAGLAAQVVERALGDQPAGRDHADAVGHALGHLEDVRGHDDCAAGGDA